LVVSLKADGGWLMANGFENMFPLKVACSFKV
jgi:hypothetical protein